MNELDYIMDNWDLVDVDSPILLPNKNRVDLAKLFRELGYIVGAEIGTARGSYAITLSINNPKCKLYCVDAWESYIGLNDYPEQNKLTEYFSAAKHRLKQYKNVEITRELSMNAVNQVADGSLDFVYIDANHEFPFVAEDIFHWSQKVRPGGIVSGHDYLAEQRKDGMVHVKEVVHAYTEAFNIAPWFVVDKCTLDRAGSFFWVKQ